jgi:hypothetical protein
MKTENNEKSNSLKSIDRLSFQIGMVNCFVEMVACGVKKMALSPPLTLDDYTKIKPWSKKIVDGFGMKSWLEKDLISTDLQSDDFVAGKWVILYYKTDNVLEYYFELKKRKLIIDKTNIPNKNDLQELSRDFMQLLSYPKEIIEGKLSGKQVDPFLLIN